MDARQERCTSEAPQNHEINMETVVSSSAVQNMVLNNCIRQLNLKDSALNLSSLLLVVAVIIIIKWITSESENK